MGVLSKDTGRCGAGWQFSGESGFGHHLRMVAGAKAYSQD